MDVSVSMQAEVSQLHYNDYTEFQLDPRTINTALWRGGHLL